MTLALFAASAAILAAFAVFVGVEHRRHRHDPDVGLDIFEPNIAPSPLLAEGA